MRVTIRSGAKEGGASAKPSGEGSLIWPFPIRITFYEFTLF